MDSSLLNTCRAFLREEEGAEVIEYALILAVISILLLIGLRDLDGGFGTFLQRVVDCLTTSSCA
jgi:pilus assembly protein Flp/PilA